MRRLTGVATSTLLALACLAVGPAPAHAAVASGSAKAGAGGGSCALTVTCGSFVLTHSMAANDLDGSVRAVGAVAGQTRFLGWSATMVPPTSSPRIVAAAFYPAGCGADVRTKCDALGLPQFVAYGGGSVAIPGGAAYMAVWPVDAFTDFTWTLS